MENPQIKAKITALKTVNSLSGGKTSSYMAVHYPADVEIFACVCIDYHRAAPKDPAILKYCLEKLNGNFIASAEHDKTLKVVMQLEQLIGKEIIWVRGKSFDDVIDNAGCLPTWNRRFCTTEMKIIPIFEYIYPRYGKVVMRIGYRADEPDRRKALTSNQDMFQPASCNTFGKNRMNWENFNWRHCECPLARTFHYEIRSFWKTKPEMVFPLDSNCRGCHHKPSELIHQNWEETPEHLEWFALQEEKKKGQKAKIHTWHDDLIPYKKIFATRYNEKIDFDFTTCKGGCTD